MRCTPGGRPGPVGARAWTGGHGPTSPLPLAPPPPPLLGRRSLQRADTGLVLQGHACTLTAAGRSLACSLGSRLRAGGAGAASSVGATAAVAAATWAAIRRCNAGDGGSPAWGVFVVLCGLQEGETRLPLGKRVAEQSAPVPSVQQRSPGHPRFPLLIHLLCTSRIRGRGHTCAAASCSLLAVHTASNGSHRPACAAQRSAVDRDNVDHEWRPRLEQHWLPATSIVGVAPVSHWQQLNSPEISCVCAAAPAATWHLREACGGLSRKEEGERSARVQLVPPPRGRFSCTELSKPGTLSTSHARKARGESHSLREGPQRIARCPGMLLMQRPAPSARTRIGDD